MLVKDLLWLDLSRFFYYAGKITRLVYDDSQVIPVRNNTREFNASLHLHSVLWLNLSMVTEDAPSGHHGLLLPSLRSLSWNITTGLSAWFLPQFVTPSVQELTINFGLLPQADVIHYPYLLFKTFRALAANRDIRLQSLAILLQKSEPRISEGVIAWVSALDGLLRLSLEGVLVKDAASILEKDPGLQELRMTLDYTSHDHLRSQFSSLAAGCPVLERVTLEITPSGDSPMTQLSFEVFSSLLQITTLRWLQADGPEFCPLAKEDVNAMGEAWPNLSMLRITPIPKDPVATIGTSMSILPDLAAAVGPDFCYFGHFLDFNSVPTLQEDSKRFIEPGFELDIETSRIPDNENKLQVAKFLAALFPNGLQLTWEGKCYNSGHFDPRGQCWKHIEDLVNEISCIQSCQCQEIICDACGGVARPPWRSTDSK